MLVALTPEQAWDRWDWIRAGLQHTIERTGVRMKPEDAYIRIRNGTAWLYLVADVGFVILTQEHDPDGLVLFIWALWCEPHKLWPIKREFYAEVEGLARKAGAKRIRWQSPREYERERWGKKVASIYEREVVHVL